MKRIISFPTQYKWIGLVLFVPFAVLGFLNLYQEFEISWLTFTVDTHKLFGGKQNITDELALTGCIVGLLLMSFARTKNEDEFIQMLRLQAWQWAVLLNFVVLLIAIWTIYNEHFLTFMVYNMLTVLAFFLVRFHYLLYKNRLAND